MDGRGSCTGDGRFRGVGPIPMFISYCMRSRASFAEQAALVCAVGALVGFVISIFQPIFDWRREDLKPLIQYFSLGLTVCTPFIIGFMVFAWLIRQNRE
jgi:hypothetical protein